MTTFDDHFWLSKVVIKDGPNLNRCVSVIKMTTFDDHFWSSYTAYYGENKGFTGAGGGIRTRGLFITSEWIPPVNDHSLRPLLVNLMRSLGVVC